MTFETQYGLTLAADLYEPKDAQGKLAALAVSGPFGACKEQSSGLYAMRMAERGFVALAFDPSYTGESSGEPRRTASPDINTEDFMAAIDFLSKQENVDVEKMGIIGICGWGGIALNAAAADTRIKATVASTMYDMTRVSGNGYFDRRLADPMAMAGGVVNPLPDDAPQFVKDYYDYYITPRGYHKRSGNSNDGWRTIGTQAFANSRFLYYINEIRSAVLVMHGEKAHSRYFGEAAYQYMVEGKAEGYNVVGKPNPNPENKELLIIPGASHCDLYDGAAVWDYPQSHEGHSHLRRKAFLPGDSWDSSLSSLSSPSLHASESRFHPLQPLSADRHHETHNPVRTSHSCGL